MIDASRLRQTFLDLLAFNATVGGEREVSLYCAEALRDAGFVCQHDGAGNLIAQKAGAAAAPRIFLSAHLDTVEPTKGLIVREEAGVFRTGGTTILGADDRAGIAEILEGMRALAEEDVAHPDLQVILTTGEEVGLLGAKALALEVVAGSTGFVFDASGPTGHIITAAPTHDKLAVKIRGKAAHAGFVPENGISALRIACRAVDRMPLGRIDPETTANVGTLSGGTADNVVAEEAFMTLEARSRDPDRLNAQVARMREALEEAARHFGGSAEIRFEREYDGYRWEPDDLPVRIAAAAWRRVTSGDGEVRMRPTGGGSDANAYNARGIPAVVLSCGYVDAHSVNEHIRMADLVAGAEWAFRIAEEAGRRVTAV